VRFVFHGVSGRNDAVLTPKPDFPGWNLCPPPGFTRPYRRICAMLVERGLRVMNVEVVGDAYAIASNYLRRSGAIPDTMATNDRLLEIIMEIFHSGEFNKIRLANLAIARFEAAAFA
jgi:hypothetical protein